MSDITNGKELVSSGVVNFGARSEDYATYRPGFPPRFFDKCAGAIHEYRTATAAKAVPKTATAATTAAAAAATTATATDNKAAAATSAVWDWAGKHVLDIGTGPGIIALELAARGSTVVGVDIAANQIAAAVKRAAELKLSAVASFHVGTAEATGCKDATFDVVLAGQCWPWFNHPIAMKELRRVLKPGGVLIVAQFCYLPFRSKLARETEELVMAMNTKWSMAGFDGLYPKQVDQLVVSGGYELIEQFAFDHPQYFTHEGWRGRMRTCNGVGSGGMTETEVKAFDERLQAMLNEKYKSEPQLVWHRVHAVIVHS